MTAAVVDLAVSLIKSDIISAGHQSDPARVVCLLIVYSKDTCCNDHIDDVCSLLWEYTQIQMIFHISTLYDR